MASLNTETSRAIDAQRGSLAEEMTARQYQLQPELALRYGEAGRAKCLQDAHFHLAYLAEAIAAGSPALFADYVAWAKVMLESRGIPPADLAVNLGVLRDVLGRELPGETAALAAGFVAAGLERLPELPSDLPSLLPDSEPLGGLARRYLDSLLAGDRRTASRLVLDAVEGGVDVRDIYLHVFQPAQREVGRLWQVNRLSVAQEHFCTAATQLIMSQLHPRIFAAERNGHGAVVTCVSGDLHEIGVRMVSDFLEMEGWDTFYLGANTPAPAILKALEDRRAGVLAVSATLTSHVRAVADLIAAVRSSPVGERVRILVGGYPFNVEPDLWRQIGADAVAGNAQDAVLTAGKLVGAVRPPGRLSLTEELVRINNEQSNTARAAMKDLALQAREQAQRDNRHYEEMSELNNELATAQRELAKKNAELARLNEQKNQFLGIAAHDLRNPLEVILTYSQFLIEESTGQSTPEHLELVQAIRSSSEFMLHLVENLLDVAKIESGHLELERSWVDLGGLVERSVNLNRQLAGRRGIEIRLACPEGLPRMWIDAAQIEQVLNNLIGNAIKFSPRDSLIEVQVAEREDGVELAVCDNGPGIPADELNKLFRPFGRTRVRPNDGGKSTGLGLAIVKKVVEGHGGEIRVKSEEGKGTAFYVELPRGK